MKQILLTFGYLLCATWLWAQSNFDIFQYRLVGPMRGGRVTAVAGTVHEPGTFYMGATGGGVWKTTDYGTTWRNVSDGYFKTPSIGAISVAPSDPNILYVGTGSDGLRSNVIVGKGMYKSVDGGATWQHIGLENVGQIGAVEIHPTNHNIVYVAAIGQAFQPNPERGIFKTTDGGRTWEKVLYISEKTGFADLELLPGNPEVIYAAAWKAERKPWTIISGGTQEEGGLYKSVDGGASWEKVTKGLPSGLIGKIDLAVCPTDSRILFALVEAPDEEGGVYKSTDQGESFTQVSSYGGLRTRPFYYTNIEVDPTNPEKLYVLATGYYRSTNGGKSWERRGSPHGDNHDMWINPENPDLFIQSNDGGANVTHNGGESWSTQYNQPTAELYQVEVDDQYPYWLYAGQQDNYSTIAMPSMPPASVQDPNMGFMINTGGCETGPAVPKPGNHNIVYANCKGRFSVFDKRTGVEKSYDVGAAYMYGHNPKDLKFRFQRVSPIHVSPHDPDVIYHTSQYVHKTTDEGKTWAIISPDLTAFTPETQVISGSPITRDITGEEFYSTIYAIRESPVQAGVIWVGANDGPVHVTQNGGETWENVTPKSLPPGGRVDAVEPSPHDAAKAYIAVLRYQFGDWKPYIYKTTDFGKSWKLLTTGQNGLPADYPARVVREDPQREGLLYAGTEFGLFISMDDGASWLPFQQNLPITPISDIKVHRNDLAISTMGRSFWVLDNLTPLHHPSFELLDTSAVLFTPRDTYRYQYPSIGYGGSDLDYPRPAVDIDYYLPEELPLRLEILDQAGKVINAYTGNNADKWGEEVWEDMNLSAEFYLSASDLESGKGLHRFRWDMRHQGAWSDRGQRRYRGGPRVAPGTYTVRIIAGDMMLEQSFQLKLDPRSQATGTTDTDVKKQEALALQVRDLLSDVRKFTDEVQKKLGKLKGEKEALSEEEAQEMGKLEAAKVALVTPDGTYMQPMLEDQISYLYNIVVGNDQVPGQDAYERYEELKKQLEALKGSLE